jgi:flagellin-like protein
MGDIPRGANTDEYRDDRGVSPTIGIVLLVAIVVVMAAVVGGLSLGMSDRLDQPSPLDAQIALEPDSAGTEAYVQSVDSPVEIRINGETIYTAAPQDTGEELFLPTAPGDEVSVVSAGPKQEVLLRQTIDPSSADYMLHYPLVDGSGTTITDESNHDNDAELGEWDGSSFNTGTGTRPSWVDTPDGTALRFDGPSSEEAAKTNAVELNEDDEVDSFTVAVKFNSHESTGSTQQLVEHHNTADNWAWYLETETGGASGEFEIEYEVHWPSAQSARTDPLAHNATHVVVGTYDGEELDLYVNGTAHVTGKELSSSVTADPAQMGDLWVGADLDYSPGQHLDGDLYEVRLYYTALDEDEVEGVSEAMMESDS